MERGARTGLVPALPRWEYPYSSARRPTGRSSASAHSHLKMIGFGVSVGQEQPLVVPQPVHTKQAPARCMTTPHT